MQFSKIVLLSVVAAVVYGIAHDQVTARICFEYFSVGHPTIIRTTSPTVMGLVWGVAATWWVGAGLGVPLGLAAQAGKWPTRSARSLIRPLLVILLIDAVAAAAAGAIGYLTADRQTALLNDLTWLDVRSGKRYAFVACLWAHTTSYAVGALGGLGLIVYVLIWRARGCIISAREGGAV